MSLKKYKIAVVGMGYVGMSIATLLCKSCDVYATDISDGKIDQIKNGHSPIKDDLIEEYMKNDEYKIHATINPQEAYQDADFIIIATPTNYDEEQRFFDTSSVENVINEASEYNPDAVIVVKSTVPVGFTRDIKKKYGVKNILFSPEFLRETKALYDNLYPSRIIVGTDMEDKELMKKAELFTDILVAASKKSNVSRKIMGYSEAEAVKLFSNAYLALRVSFFNELDTYAEIKQLETKHIIDGVCMDPRIGECYNNPSFGYGGYCLPKDTKQLLANYENVPENIIEAIVKANDTRKEFITNQIIEAVKLKCNGIEDKTVGIYRLTMKSGSDNYRNSSILDVIKKLKKYKSNLVIYEPCYMCGNSFENCEIQNDFEKFKEMSDIIVANRWDESLESVKYKVYTRDLYRVD